jgi:aminoglycoside phosphotransferase (APT) family kinase protein
VSEEPTESQLLQGVERALDVQALHARRFPTGLRHYVFEVQLGDGRLVVARIAGPHAESAIRSGAHWSQRLAALGAPLPETLHEDFDGELLGRPWVILERLPGRDLVDAYPQLDAAQKTQLLDEVCGIQELAATLESPAGFGRVGDPSQARLLASWAEFVKRLLGFGLAAVARNGAAPIASLQRVERWCDSLERQLALLRATLAGTAD